MKTSKPYEDPELRRVLGDALRPGGLEITERALNLCGFKDGARLLDLGCGPGATLEFLTRRGFQALGLDSSPGFLAEAATRGEVIAGDFCDIPLPGCSVDGVFCECVLSLAPDKKKFLTECARVMKPGGRLAVSDVFCSPETRGGPAGGKSANCAGGAMSFDAFNAAARDCGFELIKVIDCSTALKTIAARVVWHFGTAEALERFWPGGRAGRPAAYFLIIAGKGETHD